MSLLQRCPVARVYFYPSINGKTRHKVSDSRDRVPPESVPSVRDRGRRGTRNSTFRSGDFRSKTLGKAEKDYSYAGGTFHSLGVGPRHLTVMVSTPNPSLLDDFSMIKTS